MCEDGEIVESYIYENNTALIFISICYGLSLLIIALFIKKGLHKPECIISSMLLIWMCMGLCIIYGTDYITETHICQDNTYIDVTPRSVGLLYFTLCIGWVCIITPVLCKK
jgi:SNF family Na+-dependent transporter